MHGCKGAWVRGWQAGTAGVPRRAVPCAAAWDPMGSKTTPTWCFCAVRCQPTKRRLDAFNWSLTRLHRPRPSLQALPRRRAAAPPSRGTGLGRRMQLTTVQLNRVQLNTAGSGRSTAAAPCAWPQLWAAPACSSGALRQWTAAGWCREQSSPWATQGVPAATATWQRMPLAAAANGCSCVGMGAGARQLPVGCCTPAPPPLLSCWKPWGRSTAPAAGWARPSAAGLMRWGCIPAATRMRCWSGSSCLPNA